MKKFGLTGAIGSGKSTVAKIFQTLGIPCYYSDERAKELMIENEKIRSFLMEKIGFEAIQNNQLNTVFIAEKVFNNQTLLHQLNELVHPAVATDFTSWAQNQNSKYVLKEAALLHESGSGTGLDGVICVTAPELLRIERVMKRNHVSAEQVRARMNNQWSQEQKLEHSQFEILNDGHHSVIQQVTELHSLLQKI